MTPEEQKMSPTVPNVNFIWTGAMKPSSIEGPKLLASAKNNAGQSYPITYWVEEERVDEFAAEFKNFSNIQVKSINEAIHHYCRGDKSKEERIKALLLRCKTENLINVPKEILSPIIQSLTSGYFFDTSVDIKGLVNLPNLTKPALSRNLQPLKRNVKINDREVSFSNKYKAEIEDLSPVDLYAYFSAASPENDSSLESKNLFTRLADDTLSTWEQFFEKGLPEISQHFRVEFLKEFTINEILLGPITRIYNSHKKQDDETVLVFDVRTNTMLTYNAQTGLPAEKRDEEFTTIDARFIRVTEKGDLRDLFCDGQSTGISKYISGAWKKNFEAYWDRYKLKQTEESKQETSQQISVGGNPNSLMSVNQTKVSDTSDRENQTQAQRDKP